MKRVHLYLAVAGAAVLAIAAGVTAQSGASAAAPTYQAHRGIAHLYAQINLPAGVWVDTPLVVALPVAATYDLDADVRGRISGTPGFNSFITARLWNVTANTVVPDSARIINQIIDYHGGNGATGSNQTAPISELINVSEPTTIRLQALRVDAGGAASIAQIYSDANGYTSLRYQEVFP